MDSPRRLTESLWGMLKDNKHTHPSCAENTACFNCHAWARVDFVYLQYFAAGFSSGRPLALEFILLCLAEDGNVWPPAERRYRHMKIISLFALFLTRRDPRTVVLTITERSDARGMLRVRFDLKRSCCIYAETSCSVCESSRSVSRWLKGAALCYLLCSFIQSGFNRKQFTFGK